MQVVAINYGLETLMLDDGSVIPITKWLDADGDDCSKHDAEFCVGGPDTSGLWYNAQLDEFSENSLN